MKILDTDTLTLLLQAQEQVRQRHAAETEEVVITVVTRIEVLQGRFSSLLKAADSQELQRGQQRLDQAERDLQPFRVVPITEAAATEFGRLLGIKGLRRIGRGDLLIAAVARANKATLVTRNRKDFQKIPGLQIENWAD